MERGYSVGLPSASDKTLDMDDVRPAEKALYAFAFFVAPMVAAFFAFFDLLEPTSAFLRGTYAVILALVVIHSISSSVLRLDPADRPSNWNLFSLVVILIFGIGFAIAGEVPPGLSTSIVQLTCMAAILVALLLIPFHTHTPAGPLAQSRIARSAQKMGTATLVLLAFSLALVPMQMFGLVNSHRAWALVRDVPVLGAALSLKDTLSLLVLAPTLVSIAILASYTYRTAEVSRRIDGFQKAWERPANPVVAAIYSVAVIVVLGRAIAQQMLLACWRAALLVVNLASLRYAAFYAFALVVIVAFVPYAHEFPSWVHSYVRSPATANGLESGWRLVSLAIGAWVFIAACAIGFVVVHSGSVMKLVPILEMKTVLMALGVVALCAVLVVVQAFFLVVQPLWWPGGATHPAIAELSRIDYSSVIRVLVIGVCLWPQLIFGKRKRDAKRLGDEDA
jgi:hypothetical protein